MYLFVYGSLKRGQGPLAEVLWTQAEFAGEATMEGSLYLLGRYAGMVDGPGAIHGELTRLLTPATTMPMLDKYEGGDYEQVARTATRTDGSTVQAMVYVYRGSLDAAVVIQSGRWTAAIEG